MIKNYLITAWRTLTRYTSISLLNIVGLSAGMTAAVLIFLWVHNELTYDAYHPDAGRIYRMTSLSPHSGRIWESTPLPLAITAAGEIPGLESLTIIRKAYSGVVIHLNDDLFTEKNAAYVDSNWFKVFHYDFIKGSPSSFFSYPYSLILTQSKAKKYFGDKDPIGRLIHIDTSDFRVAAIIDDIPANSSFQFDVLMPVAYLLTTPASRKNHMSWSNFYYLSFLKLRPGTTPDRVSAMLSDIIRRNRPGADDSISLAPLQTIHFETDLTSGSIIGHANRSTIYIFSILGIFLLVIACINYVNLTTARASTRAKEVGIRKIIGAGKRSLFLQFLIESLVVSAAALFITLALVPLMMPVFRQLTDRNFTDPFHSTGTWKILGFTLLAAVVLNGIYPALLLSSFQPLNVLKGLTILRFRDVHFRRALVVLQFTFSIILLSGTIIIQHQLAYIQHSDPGYNRSQVFYIDLPNSLFRNKDDNQIQSLLAGIKQQLLSQTSISAVTGASESIVHLENTHSGSVDYDGRDTGFRPMIHELSADEDLAKVLQLKMDQGRWFDPALSTDRHNYILNQTAIEEFNIRKPVIGQRFTLHSDTGKIIGVVKDFHFSSLHEKITPLVIHNEEDWRRAFLIKTMPGKTGLALSAARNTWKQYVPNQPFDATFLDDEFDNLYRTDQKISTLIFLFSIIAIVISCMGLFGLAAFTARQRIKEIGIRKILGATVTDLVTLLSRDFLRLVLLSILIAIPISWWAMHTWLDDFAYHIPLSPWFFVLAGLLAAAIALLTIGSQSFRAATANPVKSLRSE